MQLPEGSHRTSLPDKYSNGTMLFGLITRCRSILAGPSGATGSWLRTPCGLRPAPSAQTTSSARSLGGWSRSAWACGVASSL